MQKTIQGKIKEYIPSLLPYFQSFQKWYISGNFLLDVIKKLNNF